MREGGVDDLAGRGGWDREPMEVPLRDGGGGRGTLDAGQDAESPEVDEHEEHAEPPGAGFDDVERFRAREVAAEEDAGEHAHPDPGPRDHADKTCEAYGQ